ncbi:MAG: UMP kinase, partial [Hyphomonadaceae bacterium]
MSADAAPPAAPGEDGKARGPYQRVLIKISGEVLMGAGQYGIDIEECDRIAAEVAAVRAGGLEVSLVIGGGNIFRGLQGAARGMDRATADYMGMMATVMNALAMREALRARGLDAPVFSGLPMPTVCDTFTQRGAAEALARQGVALFAGGLGSPFLTTDTTAAMRASEMGCDAVLKATNVDGVYSADPKKDKNATRYDKLSYHEVLARDLKVMDASAISLM